MVTAAVCAVVAGYRSYAAIAGWVADAPDATVLALGIAPHRRPSEAMCTVSVMRKDDARHDLLRSYDQPFELTGTGEVVDGKAHVHVTLGGEDVVVTGHLHRAMVRDFFVRAYLTDLDERSEP